MGPMLMVAQGAKAFVSALRAYTKHEASFIFRTSDLDFHSLATAYGLLRIPAMPEVREWRKKNQMLEKRRLKAEEEGHSVENVELVEEIPWSDEDIDVSRKTLDSFVSLLSVLQWDAFAYLSKQRETARLTGLTAKRDREVIANTTAAVHEKLDDAKKRKVRADMREAWSEQKERKAKKEWKREQKDKRKDAEWAASRDGQSEAIGPIEAFRRAKAAQAIKADESDGNGGEDGEEEKGGFDAEYKALKREVKEERAAKRARKADSNASGGMFDDLD